MAYDALALPVALAAVACLGIGYAARGPSRHAWRIAGWVLFAVYWPTQAAGYFAKADAPNAWLALLSPLLFGYLALHERRSWRWSEDPPVLKWFTGATAVAAGTYFLVYQIPPVTNALIGFTAWQSVLLLRHGFGIDARLAPGGFDANTWDITLGDAGAYAVTVVLACTAVQSIMIFVGAIAATPGVARRRRWAAYAVIVPVVWVGNLLRIAGITAWFKVWDFPEWFARAWHVIGIDVGVLDSFERFEFMHIVVGKGGSLVVMVLIALWLFTRIPELHGLILDLFDLRRRHRPGHYAAPPEAAPPVAEGA